VPPDYRLLDIQPGPRIERLPALCENCALDELLSSQLAQPNEEVSPIEHPEASITVRRLFVWQLEIDIITLNAEDKVGSCEVSSWKRDLLNWLRSLTTQRT
jgi:hypothetical protein